MINPELIKKSPEILFENVKKRKMNLNVSSLIDVDKRRRELKIIIESKRAELNKITEEIERLSRSGENTSELKEKARQIREEIKSKEEEAEKTEQDWLDKILNYPNIVHSSVPEDGLKVVKVKGEPHLPPHRKPHWEIGEKLGILDFKTGAKLSGSGFTVLKGMGAKLERALINFMIDTHTKRGYKEFFAPYLIKYETMVGTGQLPKFADDMYQVEKDNLWLIPTSEVTLVNIFRDSIIPESELTINCVTYSACFRREAGSWGRETRGIIRQHQFNKVELVKISKPEDSYQELEKLVEDACYILDLLEIPHRVVLLPADDLGFAASKTYDIEVWMPGLEKYLEISSCSNCEDFQSRRSKIRMRRKSGKIEYVHTLNGSGVAVGRCLAAILENYLQKDGRIKIPEVLQDYMQTSYIE